MVTYADRPWTKHYDQGIPESIQPFPEMTLPDFLRQAAENHPRHTAVIEDVALPVIGHQSRKLSYKRLNTLSDALAVALVDLGVKKGDRVAIVMPNVTAFVIAYFAILKAGGIVSAVNPGYPHSKTQWQLNDGDVEIVFTVNLFYDAVKQVQSNTKVRHIIVSNIADYMPTSAKLLISASNLRKNGYQPSVLDEGDYRLQNLLRQYAGQQPDVHVTPDDPAYLQYTGGTTGVHKGAMITHRALVVGVDLVSTWIAVEYPVKPRPPEKRISLAALPMFHVFGLVVLVSRGIVSGESVLLMANPRDIDGLVSLINRYKPDVFGGVPALYHAINSHRDIKSGKVSLESMIITLSGAAPMPYSLKESFESFGGRALVQGYGMSELTGATHSNPMLGENRQNSIGVPLPSVDCAVVDLEAGTTEMPVGEIGEIVIHAPHVMKEYLNRPKETEHLLRLRDDGRKWVYSGDVGYMDEDGYFYLVGRKKNMVLIGGFNVYPVQIETVLCAHPAVAEARVFGEAHRKKIGDEELIAYVVLKPGQSATNRQLISFCKERLAGYEVPRRYHFVDELPQPLPDEPEHYQIIPMLKAEQTAPTV